VPAAKLLTDGEDAFLGPRFFLIATGATDAGIEMEFFDGVQQRIGLQLVTAGEFAHAIGKLFGTDGIFHLTDDQGLSDGGGELIAETKRFRKVMSGVDMHQWERKFTGPEGFQRQMNKRDRVLTTAEQQRRAFEL